VNESVGMNLHRR